MAKSMRSVNLDIGTREGFIFNRGFAKMDIFSFLIAAWLVITISNWLLGENDPITWGELFYFFGLLVVCDLIEYWWRYGREGSDRVD